MNSCQTLMTICHDIKSFFPSIRRKTWILVTLKRLIPHSYSPKDWRINTLKQLFIERILKTFLIYENDIVYFNYKSCIYFGRYYGFVCTLFCIKNVATNYALATRKKKWNNSKCIVYRGSSTWWLDVIFYFVSFCRVL